jgi:hypothetical protein
MHAQLSLKVSVTKQKTKEKRKKREGAIKDIKY